ncbi:hypothetical protein GCM10010405_47780 [Streptomyces macrosporus]|uniref:Uncharacterized protein n=1 Tax=Streptomyces macrosporus TaxID=44032 RepID=A0ABN3KIJ4_9ACTN
MKCELEDRAFVSRMEGIAQRAAATTRQCESRAAGCKRPLPQGLGYRTRPQPFTFRSSGSGCECP